jgi:hypothetical protein
MPVLDLNAWIEQWAVSGTAWFVKRLSGNDTLANESHQAGPYIPREFLFEIFPQINTTTAKNPRVEFDLYIDSHVDHKQVKLIYYNSHFFRTPEEIAAKKRGRNEARITNLGGGESALLNPDSTGALTAFVFVLGQQGHAIECHVWVCDNQLEEELLESDIGPVDPGSYVVWHPGGGPTPVGVTAYLTLVPPAKSVSCRLIASAIPAAWLTKFPTGEEIVKKAHELRPDSSLAVDKRLLRRRDCEFEVFKSIEEAFYHPRITAGFTKLDEFLSLAQTILQSRKSRSGKSLEFHVRDIFKEERLNPGTHFTHGPTTEGNKKPDFIFPSIAAYKDPKFPASNLRMLATKTTLKDRWRQILNEADRVPTKHLLTLQEGVSENQFNEMCAERVKLVVPAALHESYPKPIRPHLMTLESFIAEVRLLTA